ncbi:DUF4345 domain-containing protein [Microbulbifer sp. OS29]|uniref:DUF4345 domain-containing protein n=1 Tax=Microbulbifer okhotskensis TaxID=2926617 RepID=A0A9X2J7B5_9GAMM|nr:DUF4345 family protein [Microbulbifer okhotskensis]MCO1335625.1 DUF4345 domain-containing protein [Microbulbifer okhotskensis]
MKYLGRVYLTLNLLVFASIGLWALFKPESLAASINLSFVTPSALPEFTATYGGLMLAIAVMLLVALAMRPHRRVAYAALSLSYIGFAAGRLYGMLILSGFDQRNILFFAVEVVLVLWGLYCYRESRWLPLQHGH